MRLSSILYMIIIYPLELIFEMIFAIANMFVPNPGMAIVFLSLAFNLLVLPLYMRADTIQKEERDKEEKLSFWVKHIKSTFKGDERFMLLQTYYRLNNYKPTYIFRSTLPILLQVPFFIAAYKFLSNLSLLKGVSFGPIRDLGIADASFMIFGFPINVLPILMTAINIFSSVIYTKGSTLKNKLQVYGLAVVFLILLYNSPSGLVLYWTLNNVFSLVKNAIYKLIETNRLLCVSSETLNIGGDNFFFIICLMYLSIFVGALIPSSVISSSVAEFVEAANLSNPIKFVIYSTCIAFGLFVFWIGIYYILAKEDKRRKIIYIIWLTCVVFTVDYMFFGTRLGNMSASLQYDVLPTYSVKGIMFNTFIILMICILGYYVLDSFPNIVMVVIVSAFIICISVVGSNTIKILRDYKEMENIALTQNEIPCITLSEEKENVIVIMMDRMMGFLIPYLMEEDPSLYEKFDGFTFYPNTVSFGNFTNVGTPALYGGYEYMPRRINERNNELLVEKQNEALKVMPVIFQNSGFDVTVCDPSYAGYTWIPDLSIYDDYPKIKKYITEGNVPSKDDDLNRYMGNSLQRDFFCFSIFKTAPLFAQKTIYNNGRYFNLNKDDNGTQVIESNTRAIGLRREFMEAYNVLDNLEGITKINKGNNTFCIIANHTTHEQTMLQLPDYIPDYNIDNSEYIDSMLVKSDGKGNTIEFDTDYEIMHYQINMAAMRKLGEWFDYLRKNNVYDNTRIIIVSDHGQELDIADNVVINNSEQDYLTVLALNCTLLVKDFGDKGFKVNDTFMTNADVPTLATEELIDNAINPFSGNIISSKAKSEETLEVIVTRDWDIEINNGYQFLPANYYSVHDDIFDVNNWKYLGHY